MASTTGASGPQKPNHTDSKLADNHYRTPIIHVIGSRPAESYVKFSDNHVTWDKPETHDNHVTKTRSTGRHGNKARPWRFESAMSNGPISNQRLREYRPLDSESSDNALGYPDNPPGYHDELPARRHGDIALLYPNGPSTHNNAEDKPRDVEGPLGGGKLNMKIVNGHMYVTQNSIEDGHTFKLARHESYMFVSLLVCACFNCPIGTIALCLSMKSQNLHDNGEKRSAQIVANVSLVMSMIGMITGVFSIIAMVFYLAHLQEEKKL